MYLTTNKNCTNCTISNLTNLPLLPLLPSQFPLDMYIYIYIFLSCSAMQDPEFDEAMLGHLEQHFILAVPDSPAALLNHVFSMHLGGSKDLRDFEIFVSNRGVNSGFRSSDYVPDSSEAGFHDAADDENENDDADDESSSSVLLPKWVEIEGEMRDYLHGNDVDFFEDDVGNHGGSSSSQLSPMWVELEREMRDDYEDNKRQWRQQQQRLQQLHDKRGEKQQQQQNHFPAPGSRNNAFSSPSSSPAAAAVAAARAEAVEAADAAAEAAGVAAAAAANVAAAAAAAVEQLMDWQTKGVRLRQGFPSSPPGLILTK